MQLKGFIRLIKFRYHLSFITVIMGALIFNTGSLPLLFWHLFILYLLFNVMLYGGLYTLNDIADVDSDRLHPQKRHRPLPSGQVSISEAYLFVALTMGGGLVLSYLYFGKAIFVMFLVFIGANLLYTRLAKKIPYVEILWNAITYPLRFLLGILLVTQAFPYLLLLAIYFLALGIATGRRILEKRFKGSHARKVLAFYTEKTLIRIQVVSFILIIILAALDYPLHMIWYLFIIILYVLTVFGIYVSAKILGFFSWIFLH